MTIVSLILDTSVAFLTNIFSYVGSTCLVLKFLFNNPCFLRSNIMHPFKIPPFELFFVVVKVKFLN